VHEPQWVSEVLRSKQPSLHWVFGGAHVPQVEPAQLVPASLQSFVQEPQVVGLPRSDSQPLERSPSQSAHPGKHDAMAHVSLAHVATACASAHVVH
jgi:hypothetical protein